MEFTQYRPSWAEVDLECIQYNIGQIKEELNIPSKIMAVVKANAYGHGGVEIAQTALKAGAEAVAVALLEEAIELRNAGIDAPILVLGKVLPEFSPVAAGQNIMLTVFQKEWIEEAEKHMVDSKEANLHIHLELDTGMNRTGIFDEEELEACLEALKKSESIYLTGAYTHFATADEEDSAYYMQQLDRFKKLASVFETIWPDPVAWHTSNSAATIHFPNDAADYIRYGVSMYGLYPSPYLAQTQPIKLKQAFSLHSRLVEVKQVQPGETISYGRTYMAEAAEWIGTVPIGYADGWLRKLQGADVLIAGKRMPIVGRICMDQFMVKLDQEYSVGEMVTLIGKQQAEEITMQETADLLDTIVYEVPCTISARIPRVYFKS